VVVVGRTVIEGTRCRVCCVSFSYSLTKGKKRRRLCRFFHASGATSRLAIALEEAETTAVSRRVSTAGDVVGEGVMSGLSVESTVADDVIVLGKFIS
jgi:hypothetical protein